MKKILVIVILIVVFVFFFVFAMAQEDKIEKITVKETYIMNIPLIVYADDYCGFFLKENTGSYIAEISYSEDETFKKATYNSNDILYAKLLKPFEVEIGDKFLVLRERLDVVGASFKDLLGGIGVVRVVGIDKEILKLKVSSLCNPVERGDKLIKYIEREPLKGNFINIPKNIEVKDFLYNGKILFIQDNFMIANVGMQIVIEGGENKGLKRGKQILFFRERKGIKFLDILGLGVVIDSSQKRSIVKLLKLKDPITLDVKWGLLK